MRVCRRAILRLCNEPYISRTTVSSHYLSLLFSTFHGWKFHDTNANTQNLWGQKVMRIRYWSSISIVKTILKVFLPQRSLVVGINGACWKEIRRIMFYTCLCNLPRWAFTIL